MKQKCQQAMKWASLMAACVFQGCAIDPDIGLRAVVSLGSDVAIFLLENLATGI